MVGELRGDRAVLGPVPGVVRAHRELVHEDPGGPVVAARLEELDREVADHAQLGGDPQGELLGLAGEALVQVGRRGDDGVADPVDLDGLDDRVGDGLAVRRADDVGRQLPHEVDLLLREDGDAGPEGLGGVRLGADHPDALAVVSAADRLEDDGEAPTSSAKAAASAASATMRWRGQGAPISVSFARITPLSWACTRASGPGRTGMPSASRARRCSVGTCSWSKVITSQPRAKARSVSRSR